MQIVETLNEGLKRAYTLKITAKDIDTRVEAELQSVAPQVRMPGFRPGKVPANLVKKMHGPALTQDAVNAAIRDGVQKTLADNKLRPAMDPSVELASEFEEGKDFEVKIELETLPDVPAADLEGIKLERLTVPVAPKEVDEAVAQLASQQKQWDDAKVTHKAKEGDLVVMDFIGKVNGKAFDGGTGEGMSVEIGSGRLIPGFEEQLVGVKANDELQIKVTFPADYNVESLKGKPATFDLVIQAVKTAKESKPDDAFAQTLGLDSLDKLKELLSTNIEQEHNGLTRTHMKRKLLDQLAAAHDFPVPPSMVDAEFNQIWYQLEQEAENEADPVAAKKEMEADKDDYRNIAERRVRLGLLLSDIGQANGVDVSQQEMNMLIGQAAQQYPPEQRQQFVQFVQNNPMAGAQIRAPLYEDKVVDFLFSKAKISDREVDLATLQAEIEAEIEETPKATKAKKPASKKADAKSAAKKDEAKAPAKKADAKAAPAKKAPAKKAK